MSDTSTVVKCNVCTKWFCFGKGTPVIMSDGSIKKIEDIKKGFKVMGPDSKPREVVETVSGTDTMYRVTQITQHQTQDFVYGRIEYTCNSNHLLVVFTPRRYWKVKLGEKVKQFYFDAEVENGAIKMVKQRSKIFGNEQEADLWVENKKKIHGTTPFEWLIMAKDVNSMSLNVRISTMQACAPMLLEKDDFQKKCMESIKQTQNKDNDLNNADLKDEDLEDEIKNFVKKECVSYEKGTKSENLGKFKEHLYGLESNSTTKNDFDEKPNDEEKMAYLFGLWIGDGFSTNPIIALDTRDIDEYLRIKDFGESLNLKISDIKQFQSL